MTFNVFGGTLNLALSIYVTNVWDHLRPYGMVQM